MEYKEIERFEHNFTLSNEVDTSYSKASEIVTKRELIIRGFLLIFGLGLIIVNSLTPNLIWAVGLIGLVMVVMSLSDVIDRLRIQESTAGGYKKIEEMSSFYEIKNAIAEVNNLYTGRTPEAKISTENSNEIQNEFLIINPWNNYLLQKHPKKASYLSKRGVGVTLTIDSNSYWNITPEFISPKDYRLIVTKDSKNCN